MSETNNIFELLEISNQTASDYGDALNELAGLANNGSTSPTGTADADAGADAGAGATDRNGGNLDVATLTLATNRIALRQSLMDMTNGIVKNASGVVKDRGRAIN